MPGDEVVPASTYYELACDYMDVVAELTELRERHQAACGYIKQQIARCASLDTRLSEMMGTDPWQRES